MTNDKRMSEERLETLKRAYSVDSSTPVALQVNELLAEIDALRAKLAAVRTVADGEVAEAIKQQSELEAYFDGQDVAHIPQGAMVIRARAAIDLLTRLSAKLAAAERERDEGRAWAKAELTRAALAGAVAQENQAAAEQERDRAREDALEEAAQMLERTRERLPERHANLVRREFLLYDAMCIRALKGEP